MIYNVIWTEFAKQNLSDIILYYSKNGFNSIANNIKKRIIASISLLENNPNIGKQKIILNKEYKFIVSGLYKIIYRVQENSIYIITIFDSRRDPNQIIFENK